MTITLGEVIGAYENVKLNEITRQKLDEYLNVEVFPISLEVDEADIRSTFSHGWVRLSKDDDPKRPYRRLYLTCCKLPGESSESLLVYLQRSAVSYS